MSGVSKPVTRPAGRAMLVGSASCRLEPLGALVRLGYACAEVDDPYAAMAELCRRPLAYRSVVLSLASLYREELGLIQAVKRRWPHIEVWLTQVDGRHAALADAMRLGADGLVSDEGLHRTATTGGPPGSGHSTYPRVTSGSPVTPVSAIPPVNPAPPPVETDWSEGEPILTADELRALLSDQPLHAPGDEGE